jgi:hypothetical protein
LLSNCFVDDINDHYLQDILNFDFGHFEAEKTPETYDDVFLNLDPHPFWREESDAHYLDISESSSSYTDALPELDRLGFHATEPFQQQTVQPLECFDPRPFADIPGNSLNGGLEALGELGTFSDFSGDFSGLKDCCAVGRGTEETPRMEEKTSCTPWILPDNIDIPEDLFIPEELLTPPCPFGNVSSGDYYSYNPSLGQNVQPAIGFGSYRPKTIIIDSPTSSETSDTSTVYSGGRSTKRRGHREKMYDRPKGKGRRKLKESQLWPAELEDALLVCEFESAAMSWGARRAYYGSATTALRAIDSFGCRGRPRVPMGDQFLGRNDVISMMIHCLTGVWRTRKQVSSHIQVLKNIRKDDEECEYCERFGKLTLTFVFWTDSHVSR